MTFNLISGNTMQVLWFVAGAAGGAGLDLVLRTPHIVDDLNKFVNDIGNLNKDVVLDGMYFIEAALEPVVVGLISGALASTVYTASSACFSHGHQA